MYKRQIEWGEIPMEDLQMISFPEDSNASALVLCDFGESVFNNDLNIVFTRHLRIKIFNPTGYEMATPVSYTHLTLPTSDLV